MAMYKDFRSLCVAIGNLTEEELSTENPKAANIFRLVDVYFNAQEESKQFGYIGVGCITYGENALILAQTEGKGLDEHGNYGENNGPV